jgi:hypothetical protein
VLLRLDGKPTPEEVALVPVSGWAGRLQTPKEVLHTLRSAQGVAKRTRVTRCQAGANKTFFSFFLSQAIIWAFYWFFSGAQ